MQIATEIRRMPHPWLKNPRPVELKDLEIEFVTKKESKEEQGSLDEAEIKQVSKESKSRWHNMLGAILGKKDG